MSDQQLLQHHLVLQHYLVLQALVAFEGCQAVLLDKTYTEAEPTMPSAEVQAKLHEVFQPQQYHALHDLHHCHTVKHAIAHSLLIAHMSDVCCMSLRS